MKPLTGLTLVDDLLVKPSTYGEGVMIKRLCAAVLVFVMGSACASAPISHSFAELPKHLNPGETIFVTEPTGSTATGTLAKLSPTSLTLLTDSSQREVPEGSIEKIQTPARRTRRGALIGLGAGCVIGLAMGRSEPSTGNPLLDTYSGVSKLLEGMILGTAGGAITGALIKVRRTIYLALNAPAARRSRTTPDRAEPD
jgi:hypothetical protein